MLQVLTRLPVRGVPWHVLELASRLEPARSEVHVLSGLEEPSEASLRPEFERRGVPIHLVGALQRPLHPWRDLLAYRAIARQIKAGRYDVVHTHISKAGILGLIAAQRSGVPVVVHTYHGRLPQLTRGFGFPLRMLEREAARRSSVLIAVSEDVRVYLHEIGVASRAGIEVIHNGVDLARLAEPGVGQGDVRGGPVIGAVGSLTPEKGLEVLLDAVAVLSQDLPQIRVCLVGDGVLRGSLERQAERLGLSARVQFVGAVPDVRPWLRTMDVLAMPSVSEGMGRSALEAMAMGIPVVASEVGGIPEAVRDGIDGLLVPPKSVPALGTALLRILTDSGLKQRLARAAMVRVREAFDVRSMVARTGCLYEAFLSNSMRDC